ncbi:Rieske (2Fe-2S) protein [Pandoraea sputorum]|uniref:Rieske [2Fe-2S] domain n=2 Tax=Burkholderiaceae TaxID=119060 RepID=A0A239SSG5_9BURK|nr:Rieske 2Fe-2S domain-containing protein [Pandoraea sputorum]SNU88357.1 Rieske [2Fe-2S] domain [Pandoraea sputorum]VVE57608.1 Rieske (2Fe-2S) protein [Pandoraea sputorum]VVE83647.1 Rieske (2Fe-2S) protein [Pandoraea sputorum]
MSDAALPTMPLPICPGNALEDGGLGVRFEVLVGGRPTPAFVIRYDGRVYGYLNQCAHVPMELDWSEGQFFETGGLYLMCATHGATYEPDTGLCVGGPCRGGALQPVRVEEQPAASGESGASTTVVWWPEAGIAAPETSTS